MKNILDFIAALILLIVLLPFMLFISALVFTTSKGPFMIMQRRIGLHQKEFKIYKFRTMYIDTPDVATHLLKNPEKYITPVGKFLRKTSLDELPQIFNILRGEMSFVGPRPALYNQYDLIDFREQKGVHNMKPGITGLAQVNGRDELSIEEKVKFDEIYVKNWSLFLDIKILFKTVINVFTSKGVVEGDKKIP